MPLPCLIAIDIDGTLLGSNGKISQRNRDALRAAHEAGIEIVISTGRRHAYAMKVLRELDLCQTNALVSSNGTVLRTVGAELIHHRHLSPATARWLVEYASGFRDALVFTFDHVAPNGDELPGALVCEASHTLTSNIDAWMRANEPYILHVDRIEDVLGHPAQPHVAASPDPAAAGPIQAMLCGTVARMDEAEALLAAHPLIAGVGQDEFPGCEIVLHRTAYPDRDLSILDILPGGCSKGSALEHLCGLRGCTMAEIVAIGDNWNDLPMLEAAGKSILMGNAPQGLLDIAEARGWRVGPTNDEDGVAQAIETLLSQHPLPRKDSPESSMLTATGRC